MLTRDGLDEAVNPPFLGSQANLAELIDTHLFVISPNNSGSTFVTRAIEKCREVWRLPREGQHMLGYRGPDLKGDQRELIWASSESYLEAMRNPALYDWPRARHAWYFQAKAEKPDASVFLTKAPPFLVVLDDIRDAFDNARFLFLVRNPYAVVEAICRYNAKRLVSREHALRTATSHVLQCFEIQQRNISKYGDEGVFFTYEQLCEHPEDAARSVKTLVPQLDDLDFDRKLAVKGIYDEPLRNMNADQIGRLSRQDIEIINEALSEREQLLQRFGYELVT